VTLTLKQWLRLALLVLLLGLFGYAGFQAWRARGWKDTAQHNAAAAQTAQANATSANVGAANATQTRAAMDAGTGSARAAAIDSTDRIQNHAPPSPAAADLPADPDVLRELREGERRARAAANRLQRAGAG
jgi:cytoskeletal protein RodZ